MNFEFGIYEQIVSKAIASKIDSVDADQFFVKTSVLDKQEAAHHLTLYLSKIVNYTLSEIKDKERPSRQIEITNKVITLLLNEIDSAEFNQNLIENQGRILEAVFSCKDFPFADINKRVSELMPYTRLSQSELFTGSTTGLPLDAEIRKEILSADEIHWLVSFIKFSGVRIFKNELEEFTKSGRKLRILTTSYMGATEAKAVKFLASLPNTEVKVSYNSSGERLHAKAYLFLRNTGFHTGYIGSSNLSRSALTKGTEWNLKITTQEVPHIIGKFAKTFDTHWEDRSFEFFDPDRDIEKLDTSLKVNSQRTGDQILSFFDLEPRIFQKDILNKLEAERSIHGRFRNLIVAATGTGKTMVSAFDFKRFLKDHPNAKLLYVAHRKEILQQSQNTFQHVLKDNNFGELWVDGMEPHRYEHVFASIQTLNSRADEMKWNEDFFDFIIIDEVHHVKANSYRSILERFSPKILLGLTATPERTDSQDILEDFCDVIAAEIRLPEALNAKILCPFQYFALSDAIDISKVSWNKGRYDATELTKIYTESNRRVSDIIGNCETYLTDIRDVRALGFCVSQAHAEFMANSFNVAGLSADYLVSENSKEREDKRRKLFQKKINYLFVVDIFNEGVDIPEIDTVLFLRPTESLTVFLQQLGRGLRLTDGKEFLTVLDFVGNARPEYDFENKFRALVGKTHTSIIKEIEDEFPHLPLGCSIILERKAKKVILDNIRNATDLRRSKLIQKIQNFKHQTTLKLSLKNFLAFNHIELKQLYNNKRSWKRLCADAGVIDNFNEPNEKELTGWISGRLVQCDSLSYLKFIANAIQGDVEVDFEDPETKLFGTMLHFDVWNEIGDKLGFKSISDSLTGIRRNRNLREEALEVIEYLVQHVDVLEKEIELGYPFPLNLHSRYSRSQILCALGLSTFEKRSSNREGVAVQKSTNTEALFITLKKSEKEYSPTTMYDDYALNDELFHWQSQNSAAPSTPTGKAYIHHEKAGRKILLFVREQNKDEFGNTLPFVFLGEANFVKHSGARPMNIEWKLEEPIPTFLLKESRKLAVG